MDVIGLTGGIASGKSTVAAMLRELGATVFEDESARRRLEAITHPRIRAWMAERQREAEERGEERVVLDIPLLYENGLDRGLKAVIVVYAPAEVGMERLMARNGFSREEAGRRVGAQMPIEEKKARATYVIDNSGTREQTLEQVHEVWSEI